MFGHAVNMLHLHKSGQMFSGDYCTYKWFFRCHSLGIIYGRPDALCGCEYTYERQDLSY